MGNICSFTSSPSPGISQNAVSRGVRDVTRCGHTECPRDGSTLLEHTAISKQIAVLSEQRKVPGIYAVVWQAVLLYYRENTVYFSPYTMQNTGIFCDLARSFNYSQRVCKLDGIALVQLFRL
jgi:hypothetical protein